VKTGGGQVLLPRKVIAGVVTFALFTDPEGNVMGLIE
jgi:predicted enzyme related to lactoylglutathione lyase